MAESKLILVDVEGVCDGSVELRRRWRDWLGLKEQER